MKLFQGIILLASLSNSLFAGTIHMNGGDSVTVNANTLTAITCGLNSGTNVGRLYCYCDDGHYIQHMSLGVITDRYDSHIACVDALRKEYLDICSRTRN